MGAQDLFDRSPEHQLEQIIDDCLANLAGNGHGGNVVKDQYGQLSPPEAATWTGKRFQLALLRSGREAWLEVREFTNVGRIAGKPIRDRADFASTVVSFAVSEAS
ncbi:hypothetical protein Bhz59_00060 [Stenotrophomonas phage vB_SmaS_Bhz59]